MRGNIVGLLAVALMCLCGVARPSIIYNVYITDGTETFSGTITTDGTIGALVASDITSWDLTATGLEPFGPHVSATGAGVECGSAGCGAVASLQYLTFESPAGPLAGTQFEYFDPPPGDQRYDLTFYPGFVAVNFPLQCFEPMQLLCGGGYVLAGRLFPSSVPEPGTLALLGLALAGLGFARKRTRGRQSTAV